MSEDGPSCIVCLGPYEKPYQAPCGHSLCGECQATVLELGSKKRRCPTCREPLGDGSADFPVNYALKESTAYIAELKSRLGESGRRLQDASVRIDVLESGLLMSDDESASATQQAGQQDSQAALIEKLRQRAVEASALQQSLGHKEGLLEEAEKSLAQQVERSSELQARLSDKEGRLAVLEPRVLELDGSLELKEGLLEAAEKKLRKLEDQQATVALREAKLAADTADLQAEREQDRDAKANAAKLIDKLKLQVKSKTGEISSLQKSLKTKISHLNSIEKDLEEQKTSVSSLQDQLTSKTNQIHSLQRSLTLKNAQIKELNKTADNGALRVLTERKQKVAQLETNMAKEIALREARVSDLDAKLADVNARREEKVAELKDALAKSAQQLQQKKKMLQAAPDLEDVLEANRGLAERVCFLENLGMYQISEWETCISALEFVNGVNAKLKTDLEVKRCGFNLLLFLFVLSIVCSIALILR